MKLEGRVLSRTVTSKKLKQIGAIASVPLLFPLGTFAQDGLRTTLDVFNRLEVVSEDGFSEPEDEGVRFVSRLTFGLTSENNTSRFGFTANTNLTYNFNDDVADRFDFDDPDLRLNYRVENRQSAFNINARYSRTDVDNANFLDEEGTGDVETGEGDRTNVIVNTGLVLGQETPITFQLNHLYARNTFSGQVDGGTSDSTTQRIDSRLSFQLSRVASLDVIAQWQETDQDDADASDRTQQSIGIGTTYALSEVLTFNGQITYDEATTTDPSTEDESGLGYRFDLEKDLRNGSIGFDFESTATINGDRQSAAINRLQLLPRGTLGYSVGVTRTGDSSLNPLIDLRFSQEIGRNDSFNINLSQQSDVNNDDEETIRTRLNVGYIWTINSVSSISANANLVSQNALDGGTDRETFSTSLSYRRDIGGDWDMVTGYEFNSSRQDGEEDRDTSTLFLGLQKRFERSP